MFIPLYFAEQARKAWQLRRVRLFVWVYLASFVVLALLQGCGGGDPEPEPAACVDPHRSEPTRIGTGPDSHDVRIPRPFCPGDKEVM